MIRPARPEDYARCLELLHNYSVGGVDNWGQTFVVEKNGSGIVGFAVCRLLDEHIPTKALGTLTQRIGRLEPLIIEPNNSWALHKLCERALHYFEDMGCVAIEGMILADNTKLREYVSKFFGAYNRSPVGLILRKDLVED